MKTNLGLTDDARRSVAAILNTLLSDEYLLYTKTKNYHWNVVGPQFSELHKFFDSQYESLTEITDEVAERVRSVGEKTFGTLAEFTKNTRLKENPDESLNPKEMIANLLSDHEFIIRYLRADLETCMSKH